MTYDVASQLQYTNIAYRTKSGLPSGATIASGGCGPSSVRNLGNNLLGWNTTIPKVARIAVDCGARYNGGTTIGTLLKAMQAKYGGFTHEYETSDFAAIAAVKAGAMAIIHTPGAVGGTYNKLLSTSGHFLCLAAVSGTTATIIDSCVTTGKWTANSVRKKYIITTEQTGVVKCSTTALSAAIDYYYIVRKSTSGSAEESKETGKDVDDMTEAEVRKIIDQVAEEKASKAVSSWAKDFFAAATTAGILDGTQPQAPLTREQFAAVMARLHLCGNDNNPSSWAADAWTAATNAGIVDGTNPHGYVTREMLAQVLQNCSLIGTCGITVKSKEVGG